MNGKEGLRHEVGFYHSENKRLRRELKMMSAQLDRLIEEKPEKKRVEHDSLAEKSALLNSLYKKCSIFK
jgi:regulator of replication initiation timing